MKHFAVFAFLLFCGQTLAQTQGGSLEFASSPIEVNSINVVTCKIVNHPLVPTDTPNVKVIVYANLSTVEFKIAEWALNANNNSEWITSFNINEKNVSESKGIAITSPSSNLTTHEFQLYLKLNKNSAKGNYFCILEKEAQNKTEILLKSKEVQTIDPLHTAALKVSNSKFTINKQFIVDCKTTSSTNQTLTEIVQVTFYKNKEVLAVYEHNPDANKTLNFAPASSKALTITEGKNTAQTDYQIQVKPLTKDAAGKYSCVATSKTIKDRTEERSYESNVQEVSNSARWALPSITFLLVNLAFFLLF